jgi:hypothetical protein
MTADDLVRSICDQNLAVYRASPIRLREDVGQEAEIAHDYRGRIVYELLQNADDAMADHPGTHDAIFVRLTDTDLWVGNSGRPLDDDDVRGLCGIGASSKGGAVNRKRASIGHKGMGFKSVLEITDAPEVISETYAFRLGRHLATEPVSDLMREIGEPVPARVPAMRFPATLDDLPAEWEQAKSAGVRTLFRFPLRTDLGPDQRRKLADRLIDLPVTAILFLKHLERIDVEVDTEERTETFRWAITRTVDDGGDWAPVGGLSKTGLYRIDVAADHADDRSFLVAHDDDLEIGDHRGGLDEYAWSGVELSEVSVAVRLHDQRPVEVEQAARVLHVFLPTGETCPYPIVINGAFSADLSRQEVRVSPDPDDYNGWLLAEAARVFARSLVPALLDLGATDAEVISLLDRGAAEPGDAAATRTGQVLVDAMRGAVADAPFVPISSNVRRSLAEIVVPPLADDSEAGSMFRSLLADDAGFDDRVFPEAVLCAGRAAFVLVDHGAAALDVSAAPGLLAAADLSDVDLELHESELVIVDPVLHALERMWSGLSPYERGEFETAVREAELFPTDGDSAGELRRVSVAERDCFYPPRALSGAIPLEGLCFLSRDLCWGDLVPKQRQELLHSQLAVWQALFGVREFKFPDVMRSSVLPALTLPDEGGRPQEWDSLRRTEVVAAVCQLSGRAPNPSAPLPYERLGPNRALFNLARLPVPCRPDASGELTWQPAYRVYFGKDWIADASVEVVSDAIISTGQEPPEVPFLASPALLVPLLEHYEHLRKTVEEEEAADAAGNDEVDIDEDEEQALDTDHRERWISFLTWLGVNHALRPVHFSDVEDRQSGWLTTKDLSRPTGWAFKTLDAEVWSGYVTKVRADPKLDRATDQATAYFYELHDLEFLAQILGAVATDADCTSAKALLTHLVENWPQLQRFTEGKIAAVAAKAPGMRKPPTARDDELVSVGDNLWLHRLRRRQFLPTTHGPKSPAATWMPTRELERRFTSRRGNLNAGQLMPILDIEGELATRARPICTLLGVRDEITSSSFGSDDARTVLDRLATIFGHGDADPARVPDRTAVREIIRPAYRNLLELLPGTEADARFPPRVLSGTPLLQEDGHGSYRFAASGETLWAERNGTRERLGNPPGLWTFVLDASPGPRVPLTRLFDVRVLEEQLHWEPEPGDIALDDTELASFRAGLQQLAPFILARLSADRATEALQARDAASLRRVLAGLVPVQELHVGCKLDDRTLAGLAQRSAFVETSSDAATRAFVTWDEHGWPPSADGAEALATAFAEAFGASHFEAFLALIRAPDEAARRRLLALAGATSDIEGFVSALTDADQPEPDDQRPEDDLALAKEPGGDAEEKPAEQPEPGGTGGAVEMTPLYAATDLLIAGAPITVTGEEPTNGKPAPTRRSATQTKAGATTGYGGRTDLSALDALGMFVAMTYEVNRLLPDVPTACIFEPGLKADQPDACVFDISSQALIALARQHSTAFDQAMHQLTANGVHEEHPGCDILTLRPGSSNPIDRLIELKSSGQHARTQAMTWNEWKTAQNDQVRSHFYLYLVANLRSDLPDARPFLRAVRDPYATIRAQEQVDHSTTRRVVLRVAEFEQAEHLELGVAASDGDTGVR